MHKARHHRGFTLIELLVVIAIIAILAALVLSTAGFIQKKGARARAEAEIAALNAALESYKADNGDYPILSNGNPYASSGTAIPGDNSVLLNSLMPPASSNAKVYFEFNKNQTNSSRQIIDPFGEPYGYAYTGSNFPVIWSRGGSTVTNQWIYN